MTKYSKEVLNAAEDSVAEAANLQLTDRAIVTAVFDTLTRAPWWEEVEVGYEFMPGEPYRNESPDGITSEHIAKHTYTVLPVFKNTYFRDTRWTPPAKPLAVGDVIETEEQAASLPVGTIAVSMANKPIRKVGINEWRRADKERGLLIRDFEMAGQSDRIIYLPSGDSE